MTRTRRRDVKELAIIRRVAAVKTRMSANERAFYEDVETAVTQYALEKMLSSVSAVVLSTHADILVRLLRWLIGDEAHPSIAKKQKTILLRHHKLSLSGH